MTYRHDGGDNHSRAHANVVEREGGRCWGAPDLLIALPGADGSGALFVEFKSQTGTVKRHQRAAHERLRAQRMNVQVVRSLEQFKRVLREHVHGAAARPATTCRPSRRCTSTLPLPPTRLPLPRPPARRRRSSS